MSLVGQTAIGSHLRETSLGRDLLVRTLLALAILLSASPSGAPQSRQPFSEEAVRQLIRGTLLQYFDPASTFEISVSGASVSSDTLYVEDVLITGKPVIWRDLRGEVLAHATGLQLDLGSLAGQELKIARVGRATVVAKSTARAVQEALAKVSSTVLKPTVRFQAGEFEIGATIKRGNKLYPTQARGSFVIEQQRRIRVVITQAQVSGSDVPLNLLEQELAKINPVLDLSKWPLNLFIQRLTLHNDTAELLATSGR